MKSLKDMEVKPSCSEVRECDSYTIVAQCYPRRMAGIGSSREAADRVAASLNHCRGLETKEIKGAPPLKELLGRKYESDIEKRTRLSTAIVRNLRRIMDLENEVDRLRELTDCDAQEVGPLAGPDRMWRETVDGVPIECHVMYVGGHYTFGYGYDGEAGE